MAVAEKRDIKILKIVRDFLISDFVNFTETVDETFNELRDKLRDLGINTIRSLDAFLGDYQELFVMNNFKQTTYVSLTTYLTVCPAHSRKAGSCVTSGCPNLHVCLFYLLSGICDFGKDCFFGHSLHTDHNDNLMTQHYLADLDIDHIRTIFQLPYVRQSVMRPQVCRYYNSRKDCKREDGSRYSCKALHLCRHYVLNDCRYGKGCRLNHDVTNDDQVLEILELYGVSTKRKPKDILEDLFIYAGDDLDSDDIRTRIHAAWLDKECTRAQGSGCPSGLQRPRTGQICTFFPKGRCKFGSACKNLHEQPAIQLPSRDVSRPTIPDKFPSRSSITDKPSTSGSRAKRSSRRSHRSHKRRRKSRSFSRESRSRSLSRSRSSFESS